MASVARVPPGVPMPVGRLDEQEPHRHVGHRRKDVGEPHELEIAAEGAVPCCEAASGLSSCIVHRVNSSFIIHHSSFAVRSMIVFKKSFASRPAPSGSSMYGYSSTVIQPW